MLGKFNIGIMGTGAIASVMAETISKMKGVKLYAVASREKIKADVFANKYSCKKAYGSYEELVMDKKVDLIYIATPHSEHYANARICLENRKPVLCEKAFTANAEQAEELIALANEKQVFLAEAIWTRYMPMLTTIQEVLGSGVIGEPKTLTANLGYVIGHVERLLDPALAGGALLDVGVYTLNFAFMMFGNNIEKMHSCCTYTDTGVDEQNTITLHYRDGKVAVLNSSMVSLSDRQGIIYGTKGFMIVENINNFESVSVYDRNYKKVASYKRPKQISGYEYEVEASIKAIKAKQIECAQMPHSETIRIMKTMDALRREWGIVYPFEKTEEGSDGAAGAVEEINAAETESAEILEKAEIAESIEVFENAENAESTEVIEKAETAESAGVLEKAEAAESTVGIGKAEAAESTVGIGKAEKAEDVES